MGYPSWLVVYKNLVLPGFNLFYLVLLAIIRIIAHEKSG